jgi:hypothetical protein
MSFSTRASTARQITTASSVSTPAMPLCRSKSTSSICSLALARSSRAATCRELRRSKSSVKQHKQYSQGPAESAFVGLTSTSINSLQISLQAWAASRRRLQHKLLDSSCSSTLGYDKGWSSQAALVS